MGKYLDMLGEIYRERERYLLNMDELLEEMHGKTKSEITDNMKVEFCCNNCRKIVEMATT